MVIPYVTDVIVHSVLQGVLASYIMVPVLWDTLYRHTITISPNIWKIINLSPLEVIYIIIEYPVFDLI